MFFSYSSSCLFINPGIAHPAAPSAPSFTLTLGSAPWLSLRLAVTLSVLVCSHRCWPMKKGGMIGVSQVGWVQPEARAWSRNKLSTMPVTAGQTHTVWNIIKDMRCVVSCCCMHIYIWTHTCSQRLVIFPCARAVSSPIKFLFGTQQKVRTFL